MKRRIQFILALVLMLNLSCASSKKKMWIAPYKLPCSAGVKQKECLMIKWGKKHKKWEYFYNNIENFEYRPGVLQKIEYEVEEIENTPMDAATLKYSLINRMSKKKVKKHSVKKIIKFLDKEGLILKPEGLSKKEIARTPSYQPKLVGQTQYSYTIVSESYEPVTYEGNCANTNGCTPVKKRFIEVNAFTKEIIEKREDVELVPNYE